jgi:hypothetical protein
LKRSGEANGVMTEQSERLGPPGFEPGTKGL